MNAQRTAGDNNNNAVTKMEYEDETSMRLEPKRVRVAYDYLYALSVEEDIDDPDLLDIIEAMEFYLSDWSTG